MSKRGDSIEWHVCPEGHLHIEVRNTKGKCISEIILDSDDAEHFAIELIAEVDRWRRYAGDTIGTVEGHA
jgi:hypothetical protein